MTTDTPFLLKPREIAKAARKAMAKGRLGYQREHYGCRYRYDDDACCAIGAALPDDLARLADDAENEVFDENNELATDCTVGELIRCGIFAVASERDLTLLADLQSAHDNMCSISRRGLESEFIAALEACEAA